MDPLSSLTGLLIRSQPCEDTDSHREKTMYRWKQRQETPNIACNLQKLGRALIAVRGTANTLISDF